MSRAEAAERITRAAIALGTAEGVGAMSLQAIARTADVSKALLLYHFAGKTALVRAVVEALAQSSETRLRRAASASDAMDAWRTLARTEAASGELALLTALALELELEPETLVPLRAARETAATLLATALLAGLRLEPRVPAVMIGRLLLRQLDGIAASATRGGLSASALESELDVAALALLALGR